MATSGAWPAALLAGEPWGDSGGCATFVAELNFTGPLSHFSLPLASYSGEAVYTNTTAFCTREGLPMGLQECRNLPTCTGG